jgi:plastocyanin
MHFERLALIVAAAAVASCSSNSYGPSGSTGGHSTTISVSNNRFSPTPDTVSAGQVTFSWSNASNGHDVTWDSGPNAQTNTTIMTAGTYSPTLITGTYHFHCSRHVSVGMSGTIVVQ